MELGDIITNSLARGICGNNSKRLIYNMFQMKFNTLLYKKECKGLWNIMEGDYGILYV